MSSFRRPFTVKRSSPGSYISGYYVEGDYEEIEVLASIQPLSKKMESSGEMSLSTNQGRRRADRMVMYSDAELKTTMDANPDIVIYRGKEYVITQVKPWQSGVINHYRYTLEAHYER